MPWPTPPSDAALPGTEYDADTDKPSLARAQLLQLKERVDALSAALKAVIDHGEPLAVERLLEAVPAAVGVAVLNRGALTKASALTFSGALVLDARISNFFSVTLTGNASVTVTNAEEGQFLTLRVKQDASGNRTVTVPGARINGAPNATASKVSYLSLAYNAQDAVLDGTWSQMP